MKLTKKEEELNDRFSLRVDPLDYSLYLAWNYGFKKAVIWKKENNHCGLVEIKLNDMGDQPLSSTVARWREAQCDLYDRICRIVVGQKVRIGGNVVCSVSIFKS